MDSNQTSYLEGFDAGWRMAIVTMNLYLDQDDLTGKTERAMAEVAQALQDSIKEES